MLGKLKNLTVNHDGTQNITITVNEDFSDTFDKLKDGDVKVEIKKHSQRRSLEANAYCWMLIDLIAEKEGIKKSEVYRNAIRDIGGVSTFVEIKDEAVETFRSVWEKQGLGNQIEVLENTNKPGWSNVQVYFGSSSYDTTQMSRLIDSLIQDAESLGIPTITDREVEKMLESWGNRKK